MPPFRRILIANRGEIAVRIARACRELGVESVAVYSDADVMAPHVSAADQAVRIGPAPAGESYLSAPSIIEAARRTACEALHPGYGFLSESASFAHAVQDAGLVWIGPPPETQEVLGNKLAARRAARQAGVPIIPGSEIEVGRDDPASLGQIGFPLMLKAAAGGGGRGMRRADDAAELSAILEPARREATAAFGDGTLYVERLLLNARHVEVQLLGDREGRLAVLGERDCSVQRRNQKLAEESPSPGVSPQLRAALFASARAVAGTVPFHNAATVEFLVDADGRHYFLEMNTRLQVEHGVTELVTGLDIVGWQLRVAAGEPLDASVLDATSRGHAIETRIYAEDPYQRFQPTGGTITVWRAPEGPGIRVDAGVISGMDVRPEYDPLLAKVLVHAEDRPAALGRLRRALDETLVGGMQTDLGFHRWLVDEPGFAQGTFDTGFVAARWGSGPEVSPDEAALAAFAAQAARASTLAAPQPARFTDAGSAWARQARQEALRR
jgi:acetyl/propionyl-CoA carboxylase alpha subunit